MSTDHLCESDWTGLDSTRLCWCVRNLTEKERSRILNSAKRQLWAEYGSLPMNRYLESVDLCSLLTVVDATDQYVGTYLDCTSILNRRLWILLDQSVDNKRLILRPLPHSIHVNSCHVNTKFYFFQILGLLHYKMCSRILLVFLQNARKNNVKKKLTLLKILWVCVRQLNTGTKMPSGQWGQI